MTVKIAKSAGFCYGVCRASDMAFAAAEEGPCVTIGPLIHNRHAVRKLEECGVFPVSRAEDVPDGYRAIIRSHGVARHVYEYLESRGVEIVDATCPYVRKIHRITARASSGGSEVLIIGEASHPEVQGIIGWCENPKVFGGADELGEWLMRQNQQKNMVLVAQTTVGREKFEQCVNLIKKQCTNHEIFDTICDATNERRREAMELSAESSAMIIIGDENSSNTRRLFESCRNICRCSVLVSNPEDLIMDGISDKNIIGLTAGASTPEWIIKEVYRKMVEEIKNTNQTENTAAEPLSASEAPVFSEPGMESFAELLEQSLVTLNTGEKVRGVVTAVTPSEVHVDLGAKHSGFIAASELSDDPSARTEDFYKVGDEIEAYILRVNDVEGTAMLSKKRLDTVKGWEDVERAREEHTTVEGIVLEENKGGIVVSVQGVRVFVPASQTGVPKDSPMSEIMRKRVKLKISEVNRPRRRVVGSIRAAASEERHALSEKVWAEIEVGKKYEGVVKSLASYGAFVDIGGVDGMVHVSELSWKRVKHPSDVMKIGDKVSVYVISFDPDKKKISLGYRLDEDNPWNKFISAHVAGDAVSVTVVKLMPFGAFAEVMPGVDGLIHISQISDRRIGKPGDVLSEGQKVDAKITLIDLENKKISLSIRALLEQADESEIAAVREGDIEDKVVAVAEAGGVTLAGEAEAATSDAAADDKE